ncbi:Bax inhibitor-1/YccA family protein [Mucilaginibacter panaciglaebae]|uniref:Bax inhibitor-1/YccA family protein n=1 Tax=Mucilaginibacter panaciglaebae TaxID=502331 RepID=A0ABP7WTT2_9SPHI
MENNNPDYVYDNVIQIDDAASSRKFLANVFLWMFIALGISAFCAFYFATNPSLLQLLIGANGFSGLGWIIMLSPLAFVMLMSYGLNRLSYPALALIFAVYAALTGVSLSFILLIYTTSSVLSVFISSSLLFGVMAVAGYTTQQDLTKFGSLMFMGLIGIVIATLVNMFMHSSGLDMAIAYIGVAVFTGLTAYDTQKLKRIGAGLEYGDATSKKYAIMGGLTLYLDFINLFLMLLRVFGRRR